MEAEYSGQDGPNTSDDKEVASPTVQQHARITGMLRTIPPSMRFCSDTSSWMLCVAPFSAATCSVNRRQGLTLLEAIGGVTSPQGSFDRLVLVPGYLLLLSFRYTGALGSRHSK